MADLSLNWRVVTVISVHEFGKFLIILLNAVVDDVPPRCHLAEEQQEHVRHKWSQWQLKNVDWASHMKNSNTGWDQAIKNLEENCRMVLSLQPLDSNSREWGDMDRREPSAKS